MPPGTDPRMIGRVERISFLRNDTAIPTDQFNINMHWSPELMSFGSSGDIETIRGLMHPKTQDGARVGIDFLDRQGEICLSGRGTGSVGGQKCQRRYGNANSKRVENLMNGAEKFHFLS